MPIATDSILVLGDLNDDKVYWSIEPEYEPPPDERPRWRTQTCCQCGVLPGGTWLLEHVIRHALAPAADKAKIAEAAQKRTLEDLTVLRELLEKERAAPPADASPDRLPQALEMALLRSVASCRPYSQYGPKVNKNKVYRLSEIQGWERYLGVDSAAQHRWNYWLVAQQVKHRLQAQFDGDRLKKPVSLCVLCDKNHGFREATDALDQVFRTQPEVILVQMNSPLAEGALWDRLSRNENCQRTILVVSASCLRAAGARIEYKTSVERTTADFACALHDHQLVRQLGSCAHLLVRFQHGVLHWDSRARTITCSFSEYAAYDPQQLGNGSTGGHTTILVAALAEALARRADRKQTVAEALRQAAQKAVVLNEWHYWNGYGPQDFETNAAFQQRVKEGRPLPYDKLFDEFEELESKWRNTLPDAAGVRATGPTPGEARKAAKELVPQHERDLPKYGFAVAQTTVAVPVPRSLDRWAQSWNRTSLYLDSEGMAAVTLGIRIVLEGLTAVFGDTKKALETFFHQPRRVAVNRFGKIETVDRPEIEQYTGLHRVLAKYLIDTNWRTPLSLAVFGPPGSGKSFAVRQVLAGLSGDSAAEALEFNLSQITEVKDIAGAFHRVQSQVLASSFGNRSDVPLILFDEFDSPFEGKELGFLKYFLGPMQDGKFKADGGHLYHIGRAIFVFAGGIAHTFHDFQQWRSGRDVFVRAKGPDFVSRLRSFLDVSGPNNSSDLDDGLVLRRAVLLRQFLKRWMPEIIDGPSDRAKIDPGIVRAFLLVGRFEHGARSMEAILQLSAAMKGGRGFQKAYLPGLDQLGMHVNAQEFLNLVEHP